MSGVLKLDDFIKLIMGQSALVLNQDATKEKLQQIFLDVMRNFSRLWKRLKDIKNAPDDTVAVPVEQAVLNKQYFF